MSTSITPAAAAGKLTAVDPWLPVAATTTTPRSRTSSIVAASTALPSGVPRLRLMTWAGYGLSGAPATGSPAAQRIARSTVKTEVEPPVTGKTLTGRTRTPGATPTVP